jgi:cysteinyl-tRNA synthetase
MLPKLKLYDTYRRGLFEFIPLSERHVTLYACGPTVYDYAHIGNLRTYLLVDVLKRVLELNNHLVKHVMNITDVGHLTSDADIGEDKMQKGARKHNKTAWEIAKYFEQAFLEDLQALNIRLPQVLCRATEHIEAQIAYILVLEKKGYTYRTGDGIYFDTRKLVSYGKLAKLKIAGLKAGIRVDLGEKRQVTDFALWKFSRLKAEQSQRQMQWSSPWGVGFPGWHIECSAMSEQYLGNRFDIHVGGEDHISVHHSNEIAQCEGRHGHQPANFWIHGYFLQLNQEKLSKSGKSVLLSDLVELGFDALSYRYLLLCSHYRSHMNFSIEALGSAGKALQRLRCSMQKWPDGGAVDVHFQQQFLQHINNDLSMPRAMAVLWAVTKSSLKGADKKATLLYFDQVCALDLDRQVMKVSIPSAVILLAQERQQARLNKNWLLSDQLRAALLQLGYRVKDTAEGFELVAT